MSNSYIKTLNLVDSTFKKAIDNTKTLAKETTNMFTELDDKFNNTEKTIKKTFSKHHISEVTKEQQKLITSLNVYKDKYKELYKEQLKVKTQLIDMSKSGYLTQKNNIQKRISTLSEKEITEGLTNQESNELTQLKNQLDYYKSQEKLYTTVGSTESTKKITGLEEYVELQKKLTEINDLLDETEENIADTSKQLKDNNSEKNYQQKKQQKQENLINSIKQSAINKATEVFEKISDSITSLFTNAIKEYENMASYSLSTSLKINKTATEQALSYGLSNYQNYALTKAMEEIGASSTEDLYTMTPAQQERFSERIGYWSSKYQELANENIFESYEEFQATLNDLKSDLQMSIIKFFAENKDLIVDSLNTGISILQGIMNVITAIGSLLGYNNSSPSSIVSDAVNNYNSNSKSVNVKIDNTFNGTNTSDVNKLRNAGNEINKQIILALND